MIKILLTQLKYKGAKEAINQDDWCFSAKNPE